MARKANLDGHRLCEADREALDAAAGSARLEGVEIPERYQRLAAAYLAGEFDEPTYRARAREMIAQDLNFDG